jgi:hypothetical protein
MYGSIDTLYDNNVAVGVSSYQMFDCPMALKSKAAAFFERASRIASSESTAPWIVVHQRSLTNLTVFFVPFRSCVTAVPAEPGQWEQVCQISFALSRFTSSLPSYIVADDSGASVRVDVEIALVHTLARVAAIQLHHQFASKERNSHEKCLKAAREVTTIVRQLNEYDYPFLDPIIGVSTSALSCLLRLCLWNPSFTPSTYMAALSSGINSAACFGVVVMISCVDRHRSALVDNSGKSTITLVQGKSSRCH